MKKVVPLLAFVASSAPRSPCTLSNYTTDSGTHSGPPLPEDLDDVEPDDEDIDDVEDPGDDPLED
mgnify:CR=1 FL=1